MANPVSEKGMTKIQALHRLRELQRAEFETVLPKDRRLFGDLMRLKARIEKMEDGAVMPECEIFQLYFRFFMNRAGKFGEVNI